MNDMTYQKWEGCGYCHAHISAEGDELSVLVACRQFREAHAVQPGETQCLAQRFNTQELYMSEPADTLMKMSDPERQARREALAQAIQFAMHHELDAGSIRAVADSCLAFLRGDPPTPIRELADDEPEPATMNACAPEPESRRRSNPHTEHLLRFLDAKHLAPELRDIVVPIKGLADLMSMVLGDGPELTTGLRRLVEAKDCLVRQRIIDLGW